MTRRSSLRANAREIYRDLAAAKAAAVSAAAPLPNPPPQGGREQKEGGGEKDLTAQNLTEEVRALYEDSAVPVREIAAVAGVTERTIYKYAARQHWKKRYARTPDFAPAKGAGSRFIARADKGLPFAQGLKATDPAGRARATAGCGEAARLSREAQAEAQRQQRADARIQAMEWVCRASGELRACLDARDTQGNKQQKQQLAGRPAELLERVHRLSLTMALTRWEALLAEEQGNAVIPAKAGIQ